MQRRDLYHQWKRHCLTAMLCLLSIGLFSQTTPPPPEGGNRINIEGADVFHFASFGIDSIRIRKLLGNVVLSQDTTKLYCDSAYQFIDSNYVEAFSHVKIVMNAHLADSMQRTITADRLTFNGETKIIDFWDHVVLKEKDVTLRTPRLTYYRIEDFAEYLQGGVIENDSNTLTSKRGYFYPKTDMAYFRNNVVLVNPDFVLKTDTLGYNTETKVAYFLAPTTVDDSVNHMYTEDGYYDTESDYAFLNQHATIGDTTYTIFADTIQYDQGQDLGKARGHIRVEQHDSSLTVYGKYAEFVSKTEASFVTDSAFAIQRMDDDTLFLFADTLSTYKDTVSDKRYFEAYHRANFYMNGLQGVCDSLVYWYDDSLMFFYQSPVLWSENSQITGDTIIVQLRNGGIDSMSIPTSPYIITQEDTVGFDQIKGKELHAKFENKDLRKMWIFGNSESIYYTKDDKEEYIGMNKARCSDMYVEFKENKPSSILFTEKPEGEFFPMHLVLYKQNLLEGFNWRGEERPPYPAWVLTRFGLLDERVDSAKLSLDSLMASLEDVEFAVYELLHDRVLEPFVEPDPNAKAPSNLSPADSLAALTGKDPDRTTTPDHGSQPNGIDHRDTGFNSDLYRSMQSTSSLDGQIRYFSSDAPGGKGGKDLYYAVRQGDQWSKPINLAALNTAGDEMFPFIHPDGTLYFSSNGWTGLGKMDVFYSKLGENPVAINMGTPVNSAGDDYGFSLESDNESGMVRSNRASVGTSGDASDLYNVKIRRPTLTVLVLENGSDAPVAGASVSIHDLTDHTQHQTMTASNGKAEFQTYFDQQIEIVVEKGALRMDPILLETKFSPDQLNFLKVIHLGQARKGFAGIVVDADTRERIPGANVEVEDLQSAQKERLETDETGSFFPSLKPLTTYQVSVRMDGYATSKIRLSTGKSTDIGDTIIAIREYKITLDKPVRLDNIKYGSGQWELDAAAKDKLKILATLMQDNPSIVVECGSHTDANGNNVANEILSQKRAEAVRTYLIDLGIAPARLTAKGYGESQPANCCFEGAQCSEEEMARNRRTEFKVTGTVDGIELTNVFLETGSKIFDPKDCPNYKGPINAPKVPAAKAALTKPGTPTSPVAPSGNPAKTTTRNFIGTPVIAVLAKAKVAVAPSSGKPIADGAANPTPNGTNPSTNPRDKAPKGQDNVPKTGNGQADNAVITPNPDNSGQIDTPNNVNPDNNDPDIEVGQDPIEGDGIATTGEASTNDSIAPSDGLKSGPKGADGVQIIGKAKKAGGKPKIPHVPFGKRPTKEDMAAKEKAKVDVMRYRIEKRAERDAKRRSKKQKTIKKEQIFT